MNERRLHAGAHDERGLVGKALVITLLILAVLGVCALDAVSILSARYRTADAADRAAEETAYAYKQSHDLRGACQTAVETVEEANHTARIPKGGCVIDPANGRREDHRARDGQHDRREARRRPGGPHQGRGHLDGRSCAVIASRAS